MRHLTEIGRDLPCQLGATYPNIWAAIYIKNYLPKIEVLCRE
jgi:hypothetical protein